MLQTIYLENSLQHQVANHTLEAAECFIHLFNTWHEIYTELWLYKILTKENLGWQRMQLFNIYLQSPRRCW